MFFFLQKSQPVMSVDNLKEGISKIIPAHLYNFIAQMHGAIWMTESSLPMLLG